VCIFTHVTSKAVHLEIVGDLPKETFLLDLWVINHYMQSLNSISERMLGTELEHAYTLYYTVPLHFRLSLSILLFLVIISRVYNIVMVSVDIVMSCRSCYDNTFSPAMIGLHNRAKCECSIRPYCVSYR